MRGALKSSPVAPPTSRATRQPPTWGSSTTSSRLARSGARRSSASSIRREEGAGRVRRGAGDRDVARDAQSDRVEARREQELRRQMSEMLRDHQEWKGAMARNDAELAEMRATTAREKEVLISGKSRHIVDDLKRELRTQRNARRRRSEDGGRAEAGDGDARRARRADAGDTARGAWLASATSSCA